MSLQIGDIVPDFTAQTTEGEIHFYDYIDGKWAVLFSHPKNFTPVCTTELGYTAYLKPQFEKRGVKVLGLSVDKMESHEPWAKDIEETQGTALNFPLIADTDKDHRESLWDDPSERFGHADGAECVCDWADKKLKLSMNYPASTGRNFDEIIRVIDSLQLTAKHQVATPVNWKSGEDVIILTSVSDDQAKEKYPEGFKTLRPYLRVVAQPKA